MHHMQYSTLPAAQYSTAVGSSSALGHRVTTFFRASIQYPCRYSFVVLKLTMCTSHIEGVPRTRAFFLSLDLCNYVFLSTNRYPQINWLWHYFSPCEEQVTAFRRSPAPCYSHERCPWTPASCGGAWRGAPPRPLRGCRSPPLLGSPGGTRPPRSRLQTPC